MSAISTQLRNLSVRTKLLTGFGLVLVILLIISVLSYNALESLSSRFQLVTDVSETNLLISEARQQEKNFILRKDMQYALRAQQSMKLPDAVGANLLTQIRATQQAEACYDAGDNAALALAAQ